MMKFGEIGRLDKTKQLYYKLFFVFNREHFVFCKRVLDFDIDFH